MKSTNVILIPLPIQIHLLQKNYYFKLLIIFQKIQPENIVTSYFQIHIKKTHTIFFEFERNIRNGKRVFGKEKLTT